MIGSIIGDVVGSILERTNYASSEKLKDYMSIQLIEEESRPTDDSVLSCAIAKCLMEKLPYAETLKEFGRLYPDAGYGAMFIEWLKSPGYEQINSFGNGAAMRVSPIGFYFNTIEEVLTEAEKQAVVTHNHPEGIKGAQAIAACVFMAKNKSSKEEIKNYIEKKFEYNLNRTLDEIRPTYEFSSKAEKTVPESIIAFLEGNDYEDTIRKAISIGGDTDTIACMAGGIAEAYYGHMSIDNRLIIQVLDAVERYSPECNKIIQDFELIIYK